MLTVHIKNIGDMAVIECEGRIVRSEAALKLREAVNSQRDDRIIVCLISRKSPPSKGGGLGMLVFLERGAHDHAVQSSPVCAEQAAAHQLDAKVRHGYARRNDGSPSSRGQSIRTSCLDSIKSQLLRRGLLRFGSAVKERSAGVLLAGAYLLAP